MYPDQAASLQEPERDGPAHRVTDERSLAVGDPQIMLDGRLHARKVGVAILQVEIRQPPIICSKREIVVVVANGRQIFNDLGPKRRLRQKEVLLSAPSCHTPDPVAGNEVGGSVQTLR